MLMLLCWVLEHERNVARFSWESVSGAMRAVGASLPAMLSGRGIWVAASKVDSWPSAETMVNCVEGAKR